MYFRRIATDWYKFCEHLHADRGGIWNRKENLNIITEKKITSKWKKEMRGWLNTSLKSTETRKELSTTCNLNKSYVKMPVSAWCYIPTSLPPKPSTIFYYPKLNSSIGHYEAFSLPWERGFIRYMPSPFYPAGIVFFQLHGGMVSLTQALATPSSTVHTSIKYLDSYHESISVLAASS